MSKHIFQLSWKDLVFDPKQGAKEDYHLFPYGITETQVKLYLTYNFPESVEIYAENLAERVKLRRKIAKSGFNDRSQEYIDSYNEQIDIVDFELFCMRVFLKRGKKVRIAYLKAIGTSINGFLV